MRHSNPHWDPGLLYLIFVLVTTLVAMIGF